MRGEMGGEMGGGMRGGLEMDRSPDARTPCYERRPRIIRIYPPKKKTSGLSDAILYRLQRQRRVEKGIPNLTPISMIPDDAHPMVRGEDVTRPTPVLGILCIKLLEQFLRLSYDRIDDSDVIHVFLYPIYTHTRVST